MAEKTQAAADQVETVVEEVASEAKLLLTEAEQLAAKVEVGIQNWIAAHLKNTVFSQDTGAWNVLQKALPHLAPAITEELK